MNIHRIHLDTCDSTQGEVRERLADADAGDVVAVSTDSQRAGKGRDGRTWEDPPGRGLMLSVGRQGPLPVSVLEDLPLRVVEALLEALGDDASAHVQWKAPNDVVSVADGAKVAGVLVDSRTVGDQVEQVVVGIGVNLDGPPFTTSDGRAATSLSAVGLEGSAHRVRELLPEVVAALLRSGDA